VLVVAGCDSAIMLDPIEEPLDAVAQLVGAFVEGGRRSAMVQGSDVGCRALRRDLGSERVAVVTTIGQQHTLARQRAEHVFPAPAVVGLAFRQLDRDREAVAIDNRVDFGRKPTAGTSHATTAAAFFSPFAACWCTRTIELSIIWILPS